ncbi:porin family protein [Dinghuibacter silviterrae]|uniref:Outer membrane protein with beta-barrel domain n=1 Tax=Dinghuibacter silviterrae TaxID=1539049 RepID=A0A4R8DEP5_9BACT|nr:porin family protein [Dinghuibacter silviterrae]TDW96019.1 outer membrane protein with beta-barrel domain [Dinghuibacter silviterrae]
MKKLVALLVVVSGIHAGASAQSFHLGATLGDNLSKINGTSFNTAFKSGFLAGAYAQIRIGSHWGIQPEVLFIQSNTKTDSSFNQIYSSVAANPGQLKDVHLNYLGIPVLLTYRILKIIDLQAGPQFGILLNNDKTLLQNGQTAFKGGDVTILTGAEVHILRLRVYARYGWGLGNINNISASDATKSDTWKNQSIQLGLGINIL